MSKWTLIGDPHAKPDNLDKINQLFDIIEDFPDDCIILGDLLDTKELVRGKCLNTYLKRMSESKRSFIVLVGNHDWFNHECKEHSLEPLKNLKNVVVVDKPWIYNERLMFIPYMHDLEAFRQALKQAEGRHVICHADIVGFDYGNGRRSDVGLDLKDFQNCKKIVSGHYHKFQKAGNITYLGTPFSHSFGETNQIKYIGTFDDITGKIALLETPFPRHTTYYVDCDEPFEEPKILDSDINRIVLIGNKENISKFDKKNPKVKYIENPKITSNVNIISEAQSHDVQFTNWAKDVKKYSKEIIDLGLEILKNV